MARFIESKGGSVHLNSEVVKIEVEDQKVTRLITKNGQHFTADHYISSIHPGILMGLINPEKIQRSYRERLQNLENTYSAFIVFVGLKPNSFPFLNYNIYYFRDYDKIWGLIDYEDSAYPPAIMMTTPPSANQGAYANHILLCGIMRYSDFARWENTTVGKRGIEYKQFKEDITNRFIDLASNVFPELKSSIDHVFSGTPLTIRDYLGSKDGTLYGYKKDCQNIIKTQIMPRTKLANLFLTGRT
jgi:all-trans-retinol 13,14-reductase